MNSLPVQTAVTSNFSIYIGVAFILIFLIIAGIFYYAPDIINIDRDWLSNNVIDPLTNLYSSSMDWLKGKNKVESKDVDSNYGPAQITNNSLVPEDTTNTFKQVWCLVGEDIAGRWCIQVPGEQSCDSDRSFPNKNDCEKNASST